MVISYLAKIVQRGGRGGGGGVGDVLPGIEIFKNSRKKWSSVPPVLHLIVVFSTEYEMESLPRNLGLLSLTSVALLFQRSGRMVLNQFGQSPVAGTRVQATCSVCDRAAGRGTGETRNPRAPSVAGYDEPRVEIQLHANCK